MDRNGAPALDLHEVTVRFGGLTAVDGVSMRVGAGERWAVIGPNGAGKTTLFRSVSGEILPTSGRIELFGQDVTRKPAHRRAHRGLGRTYQVTNLFPALTVQENVAVATLGPPPPRFRSWSPWTMSACRSPLAISSASSAPTAPARPPFSTW